jgi:Spy/CpxP family protein refolding chaperone
MAESLFPPDFVMRHQQAIGLRAEQRDYIETNLEQARPHLQEAEQRVWQEAKKLESMLRENQVNEQQILAQSDRLVDLEKAVRRLHLALMVRIKNSLSPEQQAKLQDLRIREP